VLQRLKASIQGRCVAAARHPVKGCGYETAPTPIRVRCPEPQGILSCADERASARRFDTAQIDPLGVGRLGSQNRGGPRWRWWFFGRHLSNHKRCSAIASLTKSLQLTFLIGTVAVGHVQIENAHAIGIDNRIKSERVATEKDLPTEPSYVFGGPGQGIAVTSPSIQIEKFSTILDFHYVLGSESGTPQAGCLPSWACSFWPQHASSCRKFGINVSQIKILGHSLVAKERTCIDLQSPRWGIATIFPHRGSTPIKMARGGICLIKSCNTASKYESPLIRNKRFTGQFGLSACSNPQSSSERGNENCGDGTDGRFIGLYKTAAATNVAIDSDTENGWIFFGGISAFIGFMCCYALLECWRKCSFGKYKRRDKYNKGQ